MPRPLPKLPAPTWQVPDRFQNLSLCLRLITPMFGGGVDPGEVDPTQPIRAASIRGHLRFWWRATAGAQYTTSQALFDAETALWGSVDHAGTVITRAALTPESQQWFLKENAKLRDDLRDDSCLRACAVYEMTAFPRVLHGFPGYALQPFLGKRAADKVNVERYPAIGLIKVDFNLHLTFPEKHRKEILAAVTAWVLYGGLGARTRRGCGSLQFLHSKPVTEALQNLALSAPAPQMPEDLTILHDSPLLLGKPEGDPIVAWAAAVKLYQQFRQTPEYARDAGPGRSKWPEPNSIRQAMGTRRTWAHALPTEYTYGFPRADLGLPIIFQFKDEHKSPSDPPKTRLQASGARATRFASPIITKALPEGNHYRPAILILNSPPVWHYGPIQLQEDASPNRVITNVGQADIELTPTQRLKVAPLQGHPAREALAVYAKSQGWTEGQLS